MLKNYFVIALRNFWRNKVFSLINIAGLAIGISASLVIFLLVYYDLSFDHFEKDRSRIYRVVSAYTFAGETQYGGETCAPMGAAIQKELTGVELVAPFHTLDLTKVTTAPVNASQPQVLRKQKNLVCADARYFDLIHYTWLSGTPATALNQPYQVVLTESNAHLYYPGLAFADIIGKPIAFNDSIHATITGIVKDITCNTDFSFKTFISYSTLQTSRLKPQGWDSWNNFNSDDQLFIRLAPGATASHLVPQLTRLLKTHKDPDPNDHSTTVADLQPLSGLHFDTVYETYDNVRTAHKPTLYGLLAVAAFLLLLACINFINLTTAQASQRAKEIGIRKTMGSKRGQLAVQFLNETFLLTVMATLLSIAITPLLLKVFADFVPDGFKVSGIPAIGLFLLLLIVAVTLLSGFYPALVMSGFKPISVLKNQTRSNSAKTRSAWFRKSLTVSQFVIAQVFIIATILVGRQISYALHKDLGFKKDAILYFRTNFFAAPASQNLLLQQLHTLPGIAMMSIGSDPPSTSSTWTSTMEYNDGKKVIEKEVQVKRADTNYLRLYGLRLLAGTNFNTADTTKSILINETYSRVLGFPQPQQALGKMIKWDGMKRIIGVLADFHQKSLHEAIKPLVLSNNVGFSNSFSIELQPQNADGSSWTATIAAIQKTYKSVYPDDDCDYHFVDETIAKYYTAEKNTARLLLWATGLAIFISCLGLLGLVIYITNQRTREIGIRKVFGASVTQIVVLLSRDFIKLIGLAILIAMPIGWWGSNRWLENFAYRTSLSWWIFLAGGVALLLVALVVLCLRTFRSALANPVESLRSE